MTDLFVDDAGQDWTDLQSLQGHLGIVHQGFDLESYVLRNLGFARVRTYRDSMRITFRPGFLTRRTHDAVVWHMVRATPARYVIEPFGSPLEIMPDLDDAVSRIASITADLPARTAFFDSELALARLRQTRLLALGGMLRRWRARRGEVPRASGASSRLAALNGRAMLVEITRDQAIVARLGSGYTCFDASWADSMLGRHIEEQPDPDYARRVAASLRTVHRLEQPRLELVEAVIQVPGRPPRRSRYERLLLPWRTATSRYVSSASVLRTSFVTPPGAAAV